jgi:hypothetical protein
MSKIIADIRNIYQQQNKIDKMALNVIWSQLQRANPARYGGGGKNWNRENIMETVQFYQKLGVLYFEAEEESVIFL